MNYYTILSFLIIIELE